MMPTIVRPSANRRAWFGLAASMLCGACAPASFTFSAPDAGPEDATTGIADGRFTQDAPGFFGSDAFFTLRDVSLPPLDGCSGDYTCVTCTDQNDCPMVGPWFCDPQVGRCVECTSDPECGGMGLVCAHGECRPSCDDAGNTRCLNGYCDYAEGFCVECRTKEDCGYGGFLFCGATGRCVECRSNADCDGGLCKADNGVCVQCVQDHDCGDAAFFCNQGRCQPTGP